MAGRGVKWVKKVTWVKWGRGAWDDGASAERRKLIPERQAPTAAGSDDLLGHAFIESKA